jgi:arylsulfatase A
MKLPSKLLAPLMIAGACQAAVERPNIVLILADDFGYECVTANGGESYRTPNIDRLASAGLRFDSCHVQPMCTPTRVQLMTGRYNIHNYEQFSRLRRSEITFGNVLKNAGYATGICGKWQLGSELDGPRHFGFDEAFLWQHTRVAPRYANPGIECNGKQIDYKNGEYGPTLINDFALDFVTHHKDGPFFLYYPLMLPHDPHQPSPDDVEWDPKKFSGIANQDKKYFAGMVAYLDKMVGRLVSKLDELGIRDNTLVIFMGDNGTHTRLVSRFRGQDYRGGKNLTTRRGTHVPLIASWPASIRQAEVNDDLISSVDFLPTFCELAGIAVPDNADGISFAPQLRGQKGTPREWLYMWYSPRMKQTQWQSMRVRECAFDHRYKLYRDGRFYDIEQDIDERHPLDGTPLCAKASGARQGLQAVLDHYRDARPVNLDQEYAKLMKLNSMGSQ